MGYDIEGVGKSHGGKVSLTNPLLAGLLVPVSGDITFALPKASDNIGKIYLFVKTDSNATTVTIDGYGSETINGQTTITLTEQYEAACMACDGSAWYQF